MNENAQQSISNRLVAAQELERVTNTDLEKISGINKIYVGSAHNLRTFKKCPKWVWKLLQVWTNSGESLKSFNWEGAKEKRKGPASMRPSTSGTVVELQERAERINDLQEQIDLLRKAVESSSKIEVIIRINGKEVKLS